VANQVDKLNTISITSIEKVNTLTVANIEKINTLEFTGTVDLAVNTLSTDVSGNSTRHWGLSQAYDEDNNQIIFAYGDNNNSDYGTVRVMASDKSLGTAVVFSNSGETYHTGAVYNTSDNRLMVAYHTTNNDNDYRIIGGTMGTKTVTFASGGHTVVDAGGSGVENQGDATDICSYNPTSNVAIVAIEKGDTSGDPNYVFACTIDTADDSITVGTGQEFTDAVVERFQLTYDPDIGKTVAIYDNGTKIAARVISLSGTGNRTIAVGTEAAYGNNSGPAGGGQNQGTWAVYDTTNNTHHVYISDDSAGYKIVYFTVSGTTVTWCATSQAHDPEATTAACRAILYSQSRNKLMAIGHSNASGSGTLEFDIHTFAHSGTPDSTSGSYTHDSSTGSTTIEGSIVTAHCMNCGLDGVNATSFVGGELFCYSLDISNDGDDLRAKGLEPGT